MGEKLRLPIAERAALEYGLRYNAASRPTEEDGSNTQSDENKKAWGSRETCHGDFVLGQLNAPTQRNAQMAADLRITNPYARPEVRRLRDACERRPAHNLVVESA